MQRITRVSLMRPCDGPLSTRYPISSCPRTHCLSQSVVSHPLLHCTGVFPVERGVVRTGRPQCPMLNGRRPGAGSRGRHEFREYDRKANIPFVPANVILPRVILCCRRRGRANGGGRTQCPGWLYRWRPGKRSVLYYQQNIMTQGLSIPTPYRTTGRAGTCK